MKNFSETVYTGSKIESAVDLVVVVGKGGKLVLVLKAV